MISIKNIKTSQNPSFLKSLHICSRILCLIRRHEQIKKTTKKTRDNVKLPLSSTQFPTPKRSSEKTRSCHRDRAQAPTVLLAIRGSQRQRKKKKQTPISKFAGFRNRCRNFWLAIFLVGKSFEKVDKSSEPTSPIEK